MDHGATLRVVTLMWVNGSDTTHNYTQTRKLGCINGFFFFFVLRTRFNPPPPSLPPLQPQHFVRTKGIALTFRWQSSPQRRLCRLRLGPRRNAEPPLLPPRALMHWHISQHAPERQAGGVGLRTGLKKRKRGIGHGWEG